MDDQEADVNDATGPDGWKDASIFADTFERYRQEGRDEVYAQIVERGSGYDSTACRCHYCGHWADEPHDTGCLFTAAQEAVKRKAAR